MNAHATTMINAATLSALTAPAATADQGNIRVGAGLRLLPTASAPAATADQGKIRVGAGLRS